MHIAVLPYHKGDVKVTYSTVPYFGDKSKTLIV